MPMTQEERDAEDAIAARQKPLREWHKQMAATDITMPRIAEDLIDVMKTKGYIVDEDLPELVRKAYKNKKKLRTQKPEQD